MEGNSARLLVAALKPENAAPGTWNVEGGQSAFPARALPPFFSIPDLAVRWRCSRPSVYNRIRGEKIVDFAAPGRKGHKLVPLDVVLKIERAHLRVLR